jgi:hypothetical protein
MELSGSKETGSTTLVSAIADCVMITQSVAILGLSEGQGHKIGKEVPVSHRWPCRIVFLTQLIFLLRVGTHALTISALKLTPTSRMPGHGAAQKSCSNFGSQILPAIRQAVSVFFPE